MATVVQDVSFFAERGEFLDKLTVLLKTAEISTADAIVKRLTEILDKYQEQPHLLDPVLPSILAPLLSSVRSTLREWYAKSEAENAALQAALMSRGSSTTYHNPHLHKLLQLIYAICKTRGYKVVIKHFPHEVADLEPALHCLLCQDVTRHDIWETRYVLLLWLSILVLVPFDLRTVDSHVITSDTGYAAKGIINRIIQVCKSFLPDAGAVRDAAAICLARLLTRPDLDTLHLQAFCDWCARALSLCAAPSDQVVDPGTVMTSTAAAETAGLVLGKASNVQHSVIISASGSSTSIGVVSNNIVVSAAVASFISKLEAELEIPATSLSAASRVFLSTGVMQAIVEIAKHGHRGTLKEILGDVFSRALAVANDDANPRGGLRASPLLRKLLVKLASRTGLAYMPPRVVSWRYQRGQRSLLDNLQTAGVAAAKSKAAELAGRSTTAGGAGLAEDEDPDADVPPELEDIIDILLTGLRDTDTVVRWSAAKGVGRVTGRLPRLFADDVVGAVLELLNNSEGDASWHGGCLALAELARRGLLLPARLSEVVPRVMQALSYDVRRGAHSVGQHVRDAACYVCWAFARAYAPTVMRPHVLALAQGMLITALFDREVNCRRAASAAFQENVGRQGHENFPNGIQILTNADYFTLGNRTNAYKVVAPQVAVYPQYRYALLDHLLNVKLRHWDKDVRTLAAESLAGLAHLDPNWTVEVALPFLLPLTTSTDLLVRHGATLGIAEIVLALSQIPFRVSAELLDGIRNIVVKAEKARAYTGRGGEMVRAAMCRLIECQCLANHPISRKAALRLLQTLDECLKHPNDTIQAGALTALRALGQYCFNEQDPALVERLPKTYATKLSTDENPAVRRGMSLALGALPRALLCANAGASSVVETVLAALISATKQEKQAAKRDAETRRNAVMGLTDMVLTIGLGTRRCLRATVSSTLEQSETASATIPLPSALAGETWPGLTSAQFSRVIEALVCATHDYATDNRGDVGSWVRKAALEGLEKIVGEIQETVAVNQRISHIFGKASSSFHGIPTPSTADGLLRELHSLRTPLVARHTSACLTAAACELSGVGAQRIVGAFHAGISGYGAGTRLSSSARHECPFAVATNNNLQLGQRVQTAYGSGSVFFPYGIAHINSSKVQPSLSLPAPYVDMVVCSEAFEDITPFADIIGCFLRAFGEKLDLLRGAAGESLCKLLHLAFPSTPIAGLPNTGQLQAVFPANHTSAAAAAGLSSLGRHLAAGNMLVLWRSLSSAVVEPLLDADESFDTDAPLDESVDADSGAVASTPAGEDAVPDLSATLKEEMERGLVDEHLLATVQWSLPHHSFPRLVSLLPLPAYVSCIMEGLVTSVGGLSESVVKHSSNALLKWAQDMSRSHQLEAVAGVAKACLALARPRKLQPWDLYVDGASGGTSSAAMNLGGYTSNDPSMSRWFMNILGAQPSDASTSATPATMKLDNRVITPALRTLELLAAQGSLDSLQPPASFGEDVLATCRKRAQNGRDDAIRIMTAGAVALSLVHFAEPVGSKALTLLLDLLCHPFPKVRKVVAEALYVKLLTLGDSLACIAGKSGVNVEAAVATLTETPWDSELPGLIAPRDRIYAFLGLDMPASRSAVDPEVFGVLQKAAGKGGAAEDDGSYGALVREMGY